MPRRPDLLAHEDLPQAPRQTRSKQKRARLHEAALSLFAERGYERTSIEDIARRSRLSVGTFYLHYRSKRQLLLSLTDELLAELDELELRPAAGSTDLRTAIRDVLARALARDLDHLGAYRAWQEAVLSDEHLANLERLIRAWTRDRVLRTLDHLQGLPGARVGIDPGPLASVLDSLFWSMLARALQVGEAELDRWVDAATHLLYHAMFIDLWVAKTPSGARLLAFHGPLRAGGDGELGTDCGVEHRLRAEEPTGSHAREPSAPASTDGAPTSSREATVQGP